MLGIIPAVRVFLNRIRFATLALCAILCAVTGQNATSIAQTNYRLALKMARERDFEQAIEQLTVQLSNDSTLTEVVIRLADFYRYAGMTREGEVFFQQALADHPENALFYLGQSTLYKHLGDWEAVFRSAKLALEKGATSYHAVQLLVDGALQSNSTRQLPATLRKVRRQKDQRHLYELGYAVWRLRIRSLRRARATILKYVRNSPDYAGLKLAGEISRASGNLEASNSYFRQALVTNLPLREFTDVEILQNLASNYFELSQPDSADYFFSEGLTQARAIGDLLGELAIAKGYLTLLKTESRYRELSRLCSEMAEIAELCKDDKSKQFFTFHHAQAAQLLGDVTGASELFKLAAEQKSSPNPELTTKSLLALARLALDAQAFHEAHDYATKCLTLAQLHRFPDLEHRALLTTADVRRKTGDRGQAKTGYEQVLRYAQRTQQYTLVETCFLRLANLYLDPNSDLESAQYYLSLADALARQTLKPQFAATNRWLQGKVALLLDEIERAETFFLDAIQLGNDTGVYSAVLAGKAGLIQTYLRTGFVDLAKERVDTTLAYLETHGNLCFDDDLMDYWDLKKDLFAPAVQALSKSGDLSLIFDAFEKYKAVQHLRSSFQLKYVTDLFAADSLQIMFDLEEDEILENWRTIRELWSEERRGDNTTLVQDIRDDIRQRFLARDRKRLALKERHPLLASVGTPHTETIYRLREKLQASNAVFLNYMVTEDATEILLVRADSVFYQNVAISQQELVSLVRQTSPMNHDLGNDIDGFVFRVDVATELYGRIFAPIRKWIPDKTNLIISLDGVLNLLPFECLVTSPSGNAEEFGDLNARFLVEDFNISYAPNASLLSWAEHEFGSGEKLGLFIDRDIARYEQIVEAVDRSHLALYENDKCTKAHFAREAVEQQVLHLAVPAELDGGAPLHSKLRFQPNKGDGESLCAYELLQHELHADLAILTSLVMKPSADLETGISTFFHAWKYAGVPSLVMNLWQTWEPPAKLLAFFYSNLQRGQNKAEALRRAKISFITEENRDPHLWANLVLYGDIEPIDFRSQNLTWVVIVTLLGSIVLIWVLVRQYLRIRNGEAG